MKYIASYVRDRGDGRWQAQLKYKDAEGRDRFISQTFRDVSCKRDAKALAEGWRHEENIRAESQVDAEGIDPSRTVGEYMQEYVDALRESGSLEHSTIVGYGTSLAYIRRSSQPLSKKRHRSSSTPY